LKELVSDVILDGEIIVMKQGDVDFQLVAQRNQVSNARDIEYLKAKNPATYVVFDILEKNGEILIDLPLSKRLKILKETLEQGKYVIKSQPVKEHGVEYYKAAIRKNLEGIVAKRKESTYQPGARSGDWIKIKQVKTADVVIFGYTLGEGEREDTFGSLLMGLYNQGIPQYVGKLGTGFTDQDLKSIKKKLGKLEINEQWFNEPDIPKGSVFVRPKLVAKVEYQNITQDMRLRIPSFQGFRRNKPPELCSLNQIKSQKLEEYYQKRNFSKTNEPIESYRNESSTRFVIQKHDAGRLHYDLRLERDGVLLSWAVPKGMPDELGEKRLAIHTEDHPLEYADFEGEIPKQQYGAGTVEIWDKGFYVPVKWQDNKIEFVLAGKRLKARYELIKMNKEKDQWLLFKKD
jgi:bifunctional non-homologous end joining protein LigD